MGWLESLGIAVGVLLSIVSLLGSLCGVIWWATSIWHRVNGIKEGMSELKQMVVQQLDTLWQKLGRLETASQSHDSRIARLEERTDGCDSDR